jgi:hypothetical protein
VKIKKDNYLGLKHEKINDKFEGDLTFVNYMGMKLKCGREVIAAVYKAANPNKEKGHQDYMLLYSNYDPILLRRDYYVAGRSKQEMKKAAKHKGILCMECDTVVLSLHNHDYITCDCPNKAMMDGGQHNNYYRYGAKDMSKIKSVEVNMLNDEIKIVDEK